MMDTTVITVKNISKQFTLHHTPYRTLKQKLVGLAHPRSRLTTEKFQALKNVSFSLNQGESIALLGHNGSGKSTLLQILAGIMQPTSGQVSVKGRVVPLIELGVGFHPELTGLENIFLNASLFGLKNKETKIMLAQIIEFSGLGTFIDIPVKHYSSGMYVRLGFSIAVHINPSILLADEILAVGDAEFQQKCFSKIKEMQNNGLTLVLVTHSEDQARQFCEKFIMLEHGKVINQGTY